MSNITEVVEVVSLSLFYSSISKKRGMSFAIRTFSKARKFQKKKAARLIIAEYKRERLQKQRWNEKLDSWIKVLTARVCSSQEVFQSKDVESSRESCSSKQRAYRFRKESSQKLLWWRWSENFPHRKRVGLLPTTTTSGRTPLLKNSWNTILKLEKFKKCTNNQPARLMRFVMQHDVDYSSAVALFVNINTVKTKKCKHVTD